MFLLLLGVALSGFPTFPFTRFMLFFFFKIIRYTGITLLTRLPVYTGMNVVISFGTLDVVNYFVELE